MNSSKELTIHLVNEVGSQNKVAKKSGLLPTQVNKAFNGKVNYTADQLALFVKAGLIDEETALRINYYDNLKNKKLFQLVASVAWMATMQGTILVETVKNQLCILCKIAETGFKEENLFIQ